MATIRDNSDYSRVFLYSYYTTITGWGVLLSLHPKPFKSQPSRGALSERIALQLWPAFELVLPLMSGGGFKAQVVPCECLTIF